MKLVTATPTCTRFEVIVLGPMGDNEKREASLVPLIEAINQVLCMSGVKDLLQSRGFTSGIVHNPDDNPGVAICERVCWHLETADLAVVNLTAKSGEIEASSSVLYELGLLHSLGVPTLLVADETSLMPFYARLVRVHRLPSFEVSALAAYLAPLIVAHLEAKRVDDDLKRNPISGVFGVPILDMSASLGLAIAYYDSFVRRVITPLGFAQAFPDLFKRLLIVLPDTTDSTLRQDWNKVQVSVEMMGKHLLHENLTPEQCKHLPADDPATAFAFQHVDGVIVDIPSTLYPVRWSPRQQALQLEKGFSLLRNRSLDESLQERAGKIERGLMDRFVDALNYCLHLEPFMRRDMVVITNLSSLASSLSALLEGVQYPQTRTSI